MRIFFLGAGVLAFLVIIVLALCRAAGAQEDDEFG